MAFGRSSSARWLLLAAAIVLLARPSRSARSLVSEATVESATAKETEASVLPANGKGLSFPGIYTAQYYSEATSKTAASNGESWLQRFDVLQIECEEEEGNLQDDGFRLCKGHLLIGSEKEYQRISNELESTSKKAKSSRISLDYNLSLTQEWVHPRMKVVEGHASSRQLRKPSRQLARKRNDFLFRENQYSTIPYYDCYFDYDGTMEWIQMFLRLYSHPLSPLEVSWTDIGDSWLKTKFQGGYDIFVLTITLKTKPTPPTMATPNSNESTASQRMNGEEAEPIEKAPFLIVTSTHAREYTPPILARKWIEHLLDKVEDGDPTYLSMLEHTKIHWIPYLNPDGRILAETSQPWRRKNVNNEWTGDVRESGICSEDDYGVDLNRNCPFEWGKSDGSSTHACSPFSRGAFGGSEPETQAMVQYALQIFPSPQRAFNALVAGGGDYKVEHVPGSSIEESSEAWRGYDPNSTRGVFADIHSYGKVYIYPWGNLNAICPNDLSFRSGMGHVEYLTGLDALGPGPDHYGVASGATDDWAYGVLGAFSMTWELGSKFHEPCEDFEERYERHLDAFLYLGQIAPFPFALGRGPVVTNLQAEHETIRLHYAMVEVEVEEEVEEDEEEEEEDNFWSNYLNRTTKPAVALVPTARSIKKEIVRMESNTVYDLGENITLTVTLKLPEIIESDLDPIDFDGNVESHYEDDHHDEEPSSVTKIRIFFGGTNPMEKAEFANSTFASEPDTTNSTSSSIDSMNATNSSSSTNATNSTNATTVTDTDSAATITTVTATKSDYWEMDLSSSEFEYYDDKFTYTISLTKKQMWEAFGETVNATETTFTDHMLYVQAMDNLGNPGPINAIRLSISILPELDDDIASSSGSMNAPPSFPPTGLGPQARSWESSETKNGGNQEQTKPLTNVEESFQSIVNQQPLMVDAAWILSGVGVTSLVSAVMIMVVLELAL